MAGFTIKNVSTGVIPLTGSGKMLQPQESVTDIYRLSAADYARYSESKLTVLPTPVIKDVETGDYTAPDKVTGGSVTQNITTTNPTVNDDVSLGYVAGSEWFNKTAGILWVCLDNSDGAAVWRGTELSSVVKNNYNATTNPGTGDDSADGYSVGSTWLNKTAHRIYFCEDATEGAAVWKYAALT